MYFYESSYPMNARAPQRFHIDGFQTSLRKANYLSLGKKNVKLSNLYWICSKKDGFDGTFQTLTHGASTMKPGHDI